MRFSYVCFIGTQHSIQYSVFLWLAFYPQNSYFHPKPWLLGFKKGCFFFFFNSINIVKSNLIVMQTFSIFCWFPFYLFSSWSKGRQTGIFCSLVFPINNRNSQGKAWPKTGNRGAPSRSPVWATGPKNYCLRGCVSKQEAELNTVTIIKPDTDTECWYYKNCTPAPVM